MKTLNFRQLVEVPGWMQYLTTVDGVEYGWPGSYEDCGIKRMPEEWLDYPLLEMQLIESVEFDVAVEVRLQFPEMV